MKIVIVHHLNDAQHYLFGVPEERDLKKDDLVLVRNNRGEVPAVCVCDSFSVPENVLEQLQKMYGGKTLKWVIGSVEFLRWEQEKEEAKCILECRCMGCQKSGNRIRKDF